MKMTPLFLDILFHYYAYGDDFPRLTPDSCATIIDWMRKMVLIEKSDQEDKKFQITQKGRCYAEYILEAADLVSMPYYTCELHVPQQKDGS